MKGFNPRLVLLAALALPALAQHQAYIINTSSNPWFLRGSIGVCALTVQRSTPAGPVDEPIPAGSGKVTIRIPPRATIGLQASPDPSTLPFLFRFALGDHHGDEPAGVAVACVLNPGSSDGRLEAPFPILCGAAVQDGHGWPPSVLQIVADDWRSALGNNMEYLEDAASSDSSEAGSLHRSQDPSPVESPAASEPGTPRSRAALSGTKTPDSKKNSPDKHSPDKDSDASASASASSAPGLLKVLQQS